MNNATDRWINATIDKTISSCFEMVAELTYMKTIGSRTVHNRERLRERLDEVVDIDKSVIDGLRELNDLIGVE